MGEQGQIRQRYRAKAARRPLLYWWQAFVLLGAVVLLWSQLPLTAILYEPRPVPPLHEARAAYVTLDPAYAAQAFKKSLTEWTLVRSDKQQASGLELGNIDLESALSAPEYLEQGACYPGEWQPSVVRPLRQRLPDVVVPSAAEVRPPERLRGSDTGVRVSVSPALEAVKLSFPAVKPDNGAERSGQCRFYVETGADGAVEHVLLLTAQSPGAAYFERALLKGRAAGAARGFVEVNWSLAKP